MINTNDENAGNARGPLRALDESKPENQITETDWEKHVDAIRIGDHLILKSLFRTGVGVVTPPVRSPFTP